MSYKNCNISTITYLNIGGGIKNANYLVCDYYVPLVNTIKPLKCTLL